MLSLMHPLFVLHTFYILSPFPLCITTHTLILAHSPWIYMFRCPSPCHPLPGTILYCIRLLSFPQTSRILTVLLSAPTEMVISDVYMQYLLKHLRKSTFISPACSMQASAKSDDKSLQYMQSWISLHHHVMLYRHLTIMDKSSLLSLWQKSTLMHAMNCGYNIVDYNELVDTKCKWRGWIVIQRSYIHCYK